MPHLLQPGVPVSGMHINCCNEGHPEEQLEVLLCFYNRLGWDVAAWWEPQCASEKHHMVLAHHLLSFSAGHSDKVNHWPYIMEGHVRFGDTLVPPKSYFALHVSAPVCPSVGLDHKFRVVNVMHLLIPPSFMNKWNNLVNVQMHRRCTASAAPSCQVKSWDSYTFRHEWTLKK